MKEKLLKIISCICALAVTVVMLSSVIYITARKSSTAKYKTFFNEEEDFDVLFFGSSVVINSIMPMQLWNDHGIVSYNFGGHANYISTSYWVMRNALDHTTPKLAVIDCRNMRVDARAHNQYQYLHYSLDAFPLSLTKIQAVNDLLRDGEVDNAQMLRSEMILPFVSYHSRWTELSEGDFMPGYNVEKGAESRVGVAKPMEHDLTPTDKTITAPSINREYLERFITDCQARDIEVLLLYIPTTSPEPYKEESQTIPEIAEKYNVQYLNLLQMGIVDFSTDCYDPEPHLNPAGAQKVTAYLGDYISKQYKMPNHKEDPAFAHWHADYKTYLQHRQDLFANSAYDAPSVMTLIPDGAFDYILQIGPQVLENKKTLAMLKNIGIEPEKLSADGGYVVIQKGSRNMEYYDATAFNAQQIDTALGTVTLNKTEETVSLTLDETTLLTAAASDWGNYNLRMCLITEDNRFVCREFAISS